MPNSIRTQCCIAGGGPAGVMLGFLLARAGVEVVVLEKHKNFLRDFRGDTVHPSTMELMYELGLLEDFLKCPHQKVQELHGKIDDTDITVADFSTLKVAAPFIAMMPQWDFLNFLSEQGKRYKDFKLMMDTQAAGLIEDGDRVSGVLTKSGMAIEADLVIAADGRHSTLRKCAKLEVHDFGAPMDVFWFRLPRSPEDGEETLGRFMAGKIMVLINRNDYWQCGYVIPKGQSEKIRGQGLDAFRAGIAEMAPSLAHCAAAIKSWDEVKLLTVQVNRLPRWWKKGLLCIGDAAHAMSPIGGVGINLAIQDAVAAANILAAPLRNKTLTSNHLQAVQLRRSFPTRMTQRFQLILQKNVINNVLTSTGPLRPPFMLRLMQRFPVFRRMTGYLIGIGFRSEHVKPL